MSLTRTATAVIAAMLIAAPAAAPVASAQEAITLETIGAVRMATPAEMQDRRSGPAATDREGQHALAGATPVSAR